MRYTILFKAEEYAENNPHADIIAYVIEEVEQYDNLTLKEQFEVFNWVINELIK